MSLFITDNDLIPDFPLTDKCISLDLDETLLNSIENIEFISKLKIYRDPKALKLRNRVYKLKLQDVLNERGLGVVTELAGIIRPHLREFLLFLFSYFKIVCVWSAGQTDYVHAICDIIFEGLPQPHIIFSYPQCKKDSGRIEKPLKYMFSIPELMDKMNFKNTFIIDDREDTFRDVNFYNGIVVPEFRPTFTLNGLLNNENSLQQLIAWFMKPEVINCTDVQTLDKSDIFTKPLDTDITIEYVGVFRYNGYFENNTYMIVDSFEPINESTDIEVIGPDLNTIVSNNFFKNGL
jgi:hypothetical protein